MASETDICNIALSRIGHTRQIVDISEASNEADLCRLHYTISRDSLLRSHPWNFAVQRQALAASGTTPSFEFDNAFTLPVNCLKVLRTSWEAAGYDVEYRIEGRSLLTSEATVSIEYVAKITDPAQFDAMFVDLLAQKIAAEVAMPLINDGRVAQGAMQAFIGKLTEARSIDAQEGTPRALIQGYDWVTARI